MGLASLALVVPPATAAPPNTLGYQGRILVNGTSHQGNGYFKFTLLDASATQTFWTNDGTNVGAPGGQPLAAVPLLVSNGLYSVQLGSPPMLAVPASIFSQHSDIHLRIWFSTSPGGPFELLAPDKPLTSVGYALSAELATGLVPGYDIGDSNALALQSVAPGGTLTFEATFTQTFSSTPSVELEPGWSVDAVTDSGFTASATFSSRPVDTSGSVGTYTSVAMINGYPAISYRDLGNSALKFARSDDALGAQWPTSSIVTVDGAISDSGEYSSLAEIAGHPAISYYHGATGDLRYARAANAAGSSWPASNVITVDGLSENVGWHSSLADINGIPAISYYAPNAGELRYAWAGNAEGSDWPAANVAVVDGSGGPDMGRYSSLIELDGKPAIAYYNATNGDLRFAYLSGTEPTEPTDWTIVTIDSTDVVGQHASLAIIDGNPAIAYYDTTNKNLKFARASDATGTTWPGGNIVTADGSSAKTGLFAALSVFGGRPAIAYQDETNHDLKFAWASDAQGSSWPSTNILTVDGAGTQVGSHASMASINGMPAIAYHEASPNFDLRFASLPPARWTASTGEAVPVLASGVKDGAITSDMLSAELGVWKRRGNHIYYEAGRAGIGRLPAVNTLEVEGAASKTTAGNWAANSDRRIKEDVRTVDGALETLQSIRLVSFRYTDHYRAQHPTIADQRYLNVIAQEFAQVFPEHVRPSGEFLPDGSEILQVDTYPLTIYAAAAIQELTHKLAETQSELATMQERLRTLERIVSPPPSTEQ